MKLLVTGGAGFIGSSLVDRALDLGHDVDVIDDLSSGSLANLADARARRSGALRFHHSDLGADGVDALIVRRAPDAVIHLAGDTRWRHELPPLRDRVARELAATAQVIDAAARAEVGKVVVVGHVGAAGVEDAWQRLVYELAWAMRDTTGIPLTGVDLPTVYGVRQRPGRRRSVVATFADRIARGSPCVVHGGGAQRRDLVHVDDAVDALLAATESGDGLRIAIGTGAAMSVEELVSALAAAAGVDAETVPGAARPDEPGDVVVDPARAGMYLRWAAQVDRHAALAEVMVSAAAGTPGRVD